MCIYLCVCVLQINEQDIGISTNTSGVVEFPFVCITLVSWWSHYTTGDKNRGNSKPSMHPSINCIFGGFWCWNKLWEVKNTIKLLDCCFLLRFWSVESVQTAHCWVPAISLDLLAGCQSFMTWQLSAIWLELQFVVTILYPSCPPCLAIKLCAVGRNQTDSWAVGNRKSLSHWSDAGLGVWWCGPWSRGRFYVA